MLPAEFVVNHWVLAGAVLAVLGFVAWWRSRKFPGLADDFSWVRLTVKEHTEWPVGEARQLKHITSGEFATLCALCDTFIPAFTDQGLETALKTYLTDLIGSGDDLGCLQDLTYFTKGAMDVGLPLVVANVIESHLPPDQVDALRGLFRTLEQTLGLLFLTRTWSLKGFSKLPFREREEALRRMFRSFLIPIRGAAQSLKGLVGRSYFNLVDPKTKGNHSWRALGYEDRTVEHVKKVYNGKPFKAPQLKVEKRESIKSSTVGGTDVREVTCEVVVVGSGAGGGVAAGVLTAAGVDVVVLEKGGYYTEKDFAGFSEAQANAAGYDSAGWMATEEMSLTVLAGSCVGGGTTINWCASFRTPAHVRQEWANHLGLKSFKEAAYDEALDAVCRRLKVNTKHSHQNGECQAVSGLVVNANNEALWQGAKLAGLQCKAIPRNVDGCVDCGGCERGCPYAAKQSTMSTFLEDAQASKHMRLFARAKVDKVLLDNGRAVGVVATVEDPSTSSPYTLVVWASKAVISACGSIHTPALLLRSGLRHPYIGRFLALHPVAAVAGLLTGKTFDHHKGVGMGTYVSDFMNMDGRGYGAAMETPPSHAGLTGVIVPWSSALSYRILCALKNRLAVYIPITRDRSSFKNRVFVDKDGRPRISYTVTDEDREVVVRAEAELLRMVNTLKPAMALPVHDGFRSHRRHKDGDDIEPYIKYVEAMGLPIASSQLFSAHQMCSARMATSSSQGPVNEDGQAWEVENLYVMDASVFPTSLGINPMITVEATAFMLARKLASRLKGEEGEAAIKRSYLTPTALEAQGKVSFPDGPTLTGDYGVSAQW